MQSPGSAGFIPTSKARRLPRPARPIRSTFGSGSAVLLFKDWTFKETLMPDESKDLQPGLSRRGMLGAVSLTSLGLAATSLPSNRASAAEAEKEKVEELL